MNYGQQTQEVIAMSISCITIQCPGQRISGISKTVRLSGFEQQAITKLEAIRLTTHLIRSLCCCL